MELELRRGGLLGVALRALLVSLLWAPALIAVLAISKLSFMAREVPEVPDLSALQPSFQSRVELLDGARVSGARAIEQVPYEALPERALVTFMAAEDEDFFLHSAFSSRALWRAWWHNARARGEGLQGGSTISQQLAKQFVGRERTYRRKVRELLLARRLEATYSKHELLAAYLETSFFGHTAYGLTQASWYYFDRDPRDLNQGQLATLAGLLPSPNRLSPFDHPDRALKARDRVLGRLQALGVLSASQRERWRAAPLKLRDRGERDLRYPYVHATALRALLAHGEPLEEAWGQGASTIVMTHDPDAQRSALIALQGAIRAYDERQRKGHDETDETDETTAHAPPRPLSMQGALFALDSLSGRVIASVGGNDPNADLFHRAEQACRQPGSVFKPLIYANALALGIGPHAMLGDIPRELNNDAHGGQWTPRNADRNYKGYITLKQALTGSRNIPAAYLFDRVGPRRVIALAERLGVSSRLDPGPALALGASCVSPREMTGVYAAFQNRGHHKPASSFAWRCDRDGCATGDDSMRFTLPHLSITQRLGALLRSGRLRRQRATARPALDETVAAMMWWLLRQVARSGTAHELEDSWVLGAKTGTTNDFDAWFVGFDGRLTAGVWIGSDQNTEAFARGEHGATVAMPAFEAFYAPRARTGSEQWERIMPKGVVFHRIDEATGLLARPNRYGVPYPFWPGREPSEYAPTGATLQIEQIELLTEGL